MGVRRVLPLVVALVAQAPAPASAAGSPCRPQARSAVPAPLTPAQCVEASKIVAADPTLARLLAGRAYSVDRPDPWGSGDGVHNIGAVLKIHLRKPLDAARIVLPVADFPPAGRTYRADHLAVSLHGATGFWVFVDLNRHRVVWEIPRPDGSEGPPPTSIPPYTPPQGFVPGTGGGLPGDAPGGLAVHVVTFDPDGRLIQEEWFDPLSGKAVTSIYDAERKLRVRYVSVLTGKTLTVTTIAYSSHTWTSGKGAIDPNATGVLLLDSARCRRASRRAASRRTARRQSGRERAAVCAAGPASCTSASPWTWAATARSGSTRPPTCQSDRRSRVTLRPRQQRRQRCSSRGSRGPQ